MTDKMPVVGKRYKFKSTGDEYICIPYGNDYSPTLRYRLCHLEHTYLDIKSSGGEIFRDTFEELPSANKENHTCSLEVSEVERALEELKQIHNSLPAQYSLYGKAIQNLVNALEAKKAKTHQLNTPVSCKYTPAPESKIFIDEGKVGGDYTSKIRASKDENGNFIVHEIVIEEPKIDMKEEGCKYPDCRGGCCAGEDGNPVGWEKEERVEPVSIWKDVARFEQDMLDTLIVRLGSGLIAFAKYSGGNEFVSDSGYSFPENSVKEFCVLTDFINDYEQEKLKRLEIEERLNKLEGK